MIQDLLNKYFDGETTAAEEKQLRSFFASEEVPEDLIIYKPLFAYFDEEIAKEEVQAVTISLQEKTENPVRRQLIWLLTAVAACMLLLVGIRFWNNPMGTRFCADNYVIINGKCYTDINKVRSMAFEALQEMADPAEDWMIQYTFALLLAVLCLFPGEIWAVEMQKDLSIQEVFNRYGKKKNVTMVELSNEMLETYSMTHYKSITIKQDPDALTFVRRCLENDQKNARKIKEVTDDGGIVSAYYQLPGSKTDLNRFILFKVSKKGVITLVYIEGELDSEDLISILFTEKDL